MSDFWRRVRNAMAEVRRDPAKSGGAMRNTKDDQVPERDIIAALTRAGASWAEINWLLATAWCESNYRLVWSHTQDYGVFQISPKYNKDLFRKGLPTLDKQAARALRYLREADQLMGGPPRLDDDRSLMARSVYYNAGPDDMQLWLNGQAIRPVIEAYARRVLATFKRNITRLREDFT